MHTKFRSILLLIIFPNFSLSTAIPDVNDMKSVLRFASEINYKFVNIYAMENPSSKSLTNMVDLSKMHTDLSALLYDSQKISDKSFNDYIDIFLDKFHSYDLDNTSLIESSSNTIHALKYRFQSDNNFINYITSSFGQLNNSTYLCTFASNCWQFLSPPRKDDLNVLYFGLTSSIADQLQAYATSHDVCNLKISLQRELYLFTKVLMKKQLQEYILKSYSWALKNKCAAVSRSEKPWKEEDTQIRNSFLTDMKRCISLASAVIQIVPRSVHRCDRKDHVRDVTYFELERMLQKIIANEVDLNTEESCSYNCDFPVKIMSSYKDETECEKVFDCHYHDWTLKTCSSTQSTRRYEWFSEKSGKSYGSVLPSCPGKTETFDSYLWGMRYCDYCVCTCKGKKTSDKSNIITAISFRDQISRIYDNMVVVGMRFLKKDNVIHVQIKEGMLLSEGRIDSKTVSWVDLEDFTYDDGNQLLALFNNGTKYQLIYGQDYGSPSIMNLDDILAPKDYVVTGVRLKFVRNWLATSRDQEGAVELQIQVTPFDFAKGKLLNLKQTHWVTPEYLDYNMQDETSSLGFSHRSELVLTDPDIPTKSSENKLDSQDNQFVKFRTSDLKKDAGQSTIPFFDGQPVEGEPAFPLSGVGLYHRGSSGYGGFLAFEIFDLNLSEYMKEK